jgi:hypothetical protein
MVERGQPLPTQYLERQLEAVLKGKVMSVKYLHSTNCFRKQQKLKLQAVAEAPVKQQCKMTLHGTQACGVLSVIRPRIAEAS